MAASSEAAGTPPGKGKGKLLLLGGIGLVLLLVGGGAAAYFMGLFGGVEAAAAHGEAHRRDGPRRT